MSARNRPIPKVSPPPPPIGGTAEGVTGGVLLFCVVIRYLGQRQFLFFVVNLKQESHHMSCVSYYAHEALCPVCVPCAVSEVLIKVMLIICFI